MKHAAPGPAQSISIRLMVPVAAACTLCVVASFVLPRWLGSHIADQRLRERAQSVALSVTYAAESINNVENFRRFVSALGSDPDVTLIVAVSGNPARVVASTRSGWNNRLLAELPIGHHDHAIDEAIRTQQQFFGNHKDASEIDCTVPVPHSASMSLLQDGAAMVHIDAVPVSGAANTFAMMVGVVLMGASLLIIAGAWLIGHRLVLKPLQEITDAIGRDEPAPVRRLDELGHVARMYNANRESARSAQADLGNTLREVAAFRATLDGHSIISIANRAGELIDINLQLSAISGYTRDELLGRDQSMLVSGREPGAFWADVCRTLDSGRPWRGEIRNRAKDGSHYWLDCIINVIKNQSGEVEKYVWIGSDITARKEAELELIESRARAEAANSAKSEFLANMSHEIRTPLTAILGFADILREDREGLMPQQQRAQTIDTIRNAGLHLLTVINDVLDLSKIEAGKMEVEQVETPLVTVLREVVSVCGSRASSKGLGLTAELATPLPEKILSDPTRLRQILMNLVGNALKFTEHGTISIVAKASDRDDSARLIVDIVDTGVGLTPEEAARLFKPFTQADTSITRKHGGTGLGLTICRRMAMLMGGDVILERTAPGEGSCFRVDIPLVPFPGARIMNSLDSVIDRPSLAPAPATTTLSGRVLLAEDGADNQRLISFHLRRAGAFVEIAENGRVALEMIQQARAAGTPYGLLITDIQMPEMDGYTLARTLRTHGNRLPIIALTAHAMEEDRIKCLNAGCDDYASKPIDKAHLIATCAKWLGSSHTSAGARAA